MPAVKGALDHSFQLPPTFYEAQRLFQACWIKNKWDFNIVTQFQMLQITMFYKLWVVTH